MQPREWSPVAPGKDEHSVAPHIPLGRLTDSPERFVGHLVRHAPGTDVTPGCSVFFCAVDAEVESREPHDAVGTPYHLSVSHFE